MGEQARRVKGIVGRLPGFFHEPLGDDLGDFRSGFPAIVHPVVHRVPRVATQGTLVFDDVPAIQGTRVGHHRVSGAGAERSALEGRHVFRALPCQKILSKVCAQPPAALVGVLLPRPFAASIPFHGPSVALLEKVCNRRGRIGRDDNFDIAVVLPDERRLPFPSYSG